MFAASITFASTHNNNGEKKKNTSHRSSSTQCNSNRKKIVVRLQFSLMTFQPPDNYIAHRLHQKLVLLCCRRTILPPLYGPYVISIHSVCAKWYCRPLCLITLLVECNACVCHGILVNIFGRHGEEIANSAKNSEKSDSYPDDDQSHTHADRSFFRFRIRPLINKASTHSAHNFSCTKHCNKTQIPTRTV